MHLFTILKTSDTELSCPSTIIIKKAHQQKAANICKTILLKILNLVQTRKN